MRRRTASLLVTAALWSTCANADCPSFRIDKSDLIARKLLSQYAIVFTAMILRTRYTGNWTGTERFPIEEDYQIIERIKGDMPSRTTLRTPCVEVFDCAETPTAMAKYVKDRAGHGLIVLANEEKRESGRIVLVASVCPLLADMDLNSRGARALAAALKRLTKIR